MDVNFVGRARAPGPGDRRPRWYAASAPATAPPVGSLAKAVGAGR